LGTLSITGINSMAMKVSPAALAVDEHLRSRSERDAQRFEGLRIAALRRAVAREPM